MAKPEGGCVVLNKTESPRLALRPREAARALGISERTLWSWTREGRIPYRRQGRCLIYPVAALEAWLNSGMDADCMEGQSHET